MIVENTIEKKIILVKEELESKISAAVLTKLYEMKKEIAKRYSDKKEVGETGVDADDVDEVQ